MVTLIENFRLWRFRRRYRLRWYWHFNRGTDRATVQAMYLDNGRLEMWVYMWGSGWLFDMHIDGKPHLTNATLLIHAGNDIRTVLRTAELLLMRHRYHDFMCKAA